MGAACAEGAISRAQRTDGHRSVGLSKCEPCVKIHLEEARMLGISEEEISEAVWMAISLSRAHNDVCRRPCGEA